MNTERLRGVLVTNRFLRTDKFVEHYEWLEKAAVRYGIQLSLLCNTDLLYPFGEDTFRTESRLRKRVEGIVAENDFVLYWDKDILLGRLLQELCNRKKIPMFNQIDAIALCDNKWDTYQKLWEYNQRSTKEERIPLLPSIAAPMTYSNVGYTDTDFVEDVMDALGLPLVIKECYGSFGMQVYLAETFQEVVDRTKQLAGKPFLYQKYLKESCGRDVRLQVVGDKVVAAMYRFSDTDFRANITNGGRMKPYQASPEECALAVRTAKVLGLDFAGVDLLFWREQAKVVCEVNSNAHFKNIYTCTGVNTALCIMEYISQKIKG